CRREFNRLCATASLSLSSSCAAIMAELPWGLQGADATSSKRTVKFRNGTRVPAIGQGSWHLAQGRHPGATEEEALRTGVSLGMTVIDTAEAYGSGRAEKLIGRVVAGQRDKVFLVSKVLPSHSAGDGIARSCDESLARLGVDYLDLYLLHWRERDTDLAHDVAEFEALREREKIRAWGVSNFTISDMEDLFRVPGGDGCATNQVRYNLSTRAIEYDLLPWSQQHGIPVMAYSPLGIGSLVRDPTLERIGAADHCAGTAVALAWAVRDGNVIAIPESGSPAHVTQNAAALSLTLMPEDLQLLDTAHPVRWTDLLRFLYHDATRWLHRVEDSF